MPPGRGLAADRPRLGGREKWILGAVCGLLATLIVVVAISLASASHRSANGCIDVSLPYSTGGVEIYRCGEQARAMCSSAGGAGAYRGAAARSLATQCRKARLPVG